MIAKERYEELLKEVEANIDLLREKIEKHQKDFKSDNENWGFVGDLSQWNEKLKEIIGNH